MMSEQGRGTASFRKIVTDITRGIIITNDCTSERYYSHGAEVGKVPLNRTYCKLKYGNSAGSGISVAKSTVDKLLRGYDIRLRPDFGDAMRDNMTGKPSCTRDLMVRSHSAGKKLVGFEWACAVVVSSDSCGLCRGNEGYSKRETGGTVNTRPFQLLSHLTSPRRDLPVPVREDGT
ncbi:gamma-aminobutyric acid receptor subunit beta-4-like isoform X1, partial [Clarias magur]